jgi:hypothetical protein
MQKLIQRVNTSATDCTKQLKQSSSSSPFAAEDKMQVHFVSRFLLGLILVFCSNLVLLCDK